MKILSFGEVLWDVYPDRKLIGGAPFNFAAHLAKHREDVYMLSSVGNDLLGRETVDRMNTFGIRTDYVAICDSAHTGRCIVTLDHNAVPSYNLLNNVAYDYIDSGIVGENFDVLYFGTLALRSEFNRNSLSNLLKRRDFGEVFVDVNIRKPYYSSETVRFAAEKATIIKISDEELPIVADILNIDSDLDYVDFTSALSHHCQNLNTIIITLGEKGAFVYDVQNAAKYFCGGSKVTAVSTVGAGDSFSAAFLHRYLKGFNLNDCLFYATKIAALVVSSFDAVPEYDPDHV